jgi:solute carrier family 25 carnitine/acylcarnitine transporter 20/29
MHSQGSWYRGMGATLLRDIPANSIWFASYYLWKDYLMTATNSTQALYVAPFAGAIAGMSSWSLIMPLDTIKTRIQSSHKNISIWQVCRNIAQEPRSIWKTLYRGWLVAVLRSIPSNAVGWTATEFTLRALMKHDYH